METTQVYAPLAPAVVDQPTPKSLHIQDVACLRTFAAAAFALCVVGIPFHYTNPKIPVFHTLAAISYGAHALMSAYVFVRAHRKGDLSSSLIRLYAHAGLFVVTAFMLYMGPFSPAVLGLVFGISFFGLSQRARIVILDVSVLILLYTAIGLAMSFDLLPDVGVFSSAGVPRSARVTMVAFIAAMFVCSLLHARSSRRSTEMAIARAAAAAREIQQRDVQLKEAHDDIAALRAATAGRYTDATFGAWRLGEILGRGAMGEVYAAVHLRTGERAAVKVLNAYAAGDPKLVRRFLREAELTAKVHGEHVVRVFEAGASSDGTPYIAMERLEGADLRGVLRSEGRLSAERAVELVEHVARGLESAHDAGVVHRDLKPANLFLAKRGSSEAWTILDFGIARLRSGSGTLTHGDVLGTPGYIAPEQVLGEPGDVRADIFSFGAVVYRVLTGGAPFEGTAVSSLHAVVFEGPRRPRDLVPSLPPDVERVLAIALAKDPAVRFESATAFAAAFRSAVTSDLSPALRERADVLITERAWNLAA
jgi:serine/threonine-protein kinase